MDILWGFEFIATLYTYKDCSGYMCIMSKIGCSKVIVKQSLLSTSENEFDGAFANVDIKKDELVEYGIVRRLSGNDNRVFDGMNNPHVFTWSDSMPIIHGLSHQVVLRSTTRV